MRALRSLMNSTTCGPLPGILNAQVQINEDSWQWIEGQQVSYVCDDGFELTKGNLTLTCGEDGTWEGSVPFCETLCKTYLFFNLFILQ